MELQQQSMGTRLAIRLMLLTIISGIYYVLNNSQFVRGVVIGQMAIVAAICFAEALWVMLVVHTWKSIRNENRVGTSDDRRPVVTPGNVEVNNSQSLIYTNF